MNPLWTEPPIGTRWSWESTDEATRDAMRLALRTGVALVEHPHSAEPFVGPHPINEDSEP